MREGHAAHNMLVVELVQLIASNGIPHARTKVRGGSGGQQRGVVQHARPDRALQRQDSGVQGSIQGQQCGSSRAQGAAAMSAAAPGVVGGCANAEVAAGDGEGCVSAGPCAP